MPFRPIRVLIVDDHSLFRMGLRMRLELEPDLEVVGEAAGGKQALELAPGLHPDVVLMDHKMPGMDGIEATRLLLAQHPHMAVLLLSTYTSPPNQELARDNGARGYISKFAEYPTLLDAIRQMYRPAADPDDTHDLNDTQPR
jgi:DNA-binding NarL/FixJ family response regulator